MSLRSLCLVCCALFIAASGCDKKPKTPPQSSTSPGSSSNTFVEQTVDNPKPGTPEALVQTALKAGTMTDEAKGWELFKPLVAPSEMPTVKAEISWRRFAWARFRRQVKLYLTKPGTHQFVIKRRVTNKLCVKLFLKNKIRELPTPLKMCKTTPTGNWMIATFSL